MRIAAALSIAAIALMATSASAHTDKYGTFKAQVALPYVPHDKLTELGDLAEGYVTKLAGRPAVILSAWMFPHTNPDGSDTISICGIATIDGKTKHTFTLPPQDSSADNVWDATADDYADAGCYGAHYVIR